MNIRRVETPEVFRVNVIKKITKGDLSYIVGSVFFNFIADQFQSKSCIIMFCCVCELATNC